MYKDSLLPLVGVKYFLHSNMLDSVVQDGQSRTTPTEEVVQLMMLPRERLSLYNIYNIYNVEETGLFSKFLPGRTYVLKTEEKTLCGTLAISAKDLTPEYVCSNLKGSHKISLTIIGKSKKPRCFHYSPPTLPYFANK